MWWWNDRAREPALWVFLSTCFTTFKVCVLRLHFIVPDTSAIYLYTWLQKMYWVWGKELGTRRGTHFLLIFFKIKIQWTAIPYNNLWASLIYIYSDFSGGSPVYFLWSTLTTQRASRAFINRAQQKPVYSLFLIDGPEEQLTNLTRSDTEPSWSRFWWLLQIFGLHTTKPGNNVSKVLNRIHMAVNFCLALTCNTSPL